MLRLTVALAAVACASEFSLRIEYPPAGSVVEIEALDHPCSGVKLGIERAAGSEMVHSVPSAVLRSGRYVTITRRHRDPDPAMKHAIDVPARKVSDASSDAYVPQAHA